MTAERGAAAADPYQALPVDSAVSFELPGDLPALETEDHACEITPRSILEAILFVGHPSDGCLSSRYLAALMRGVRPAEIDALVGELNDEYRQNGCPYEITAEAAGYRMVLRGEFEGLREVFQGKIREARLSQTAIDVLAVVAYHQPVERERIEEFCESASPALLSQLVRRGLLSVEKSPTGGKHSLYRTTDRFLQLFGLESLGELPQSQELGER